MVAIEPEALLEHRDFVEALARQLVWDESSADDVAQQTWLSALEHPPRHDKSIRSWLSRIVRNVAFTRRTLDQRRQKREQAAATPESVPSAAETYDRIVTVRRVAEALIALPEPYRHTILLRFYEGKSPREIAESLNLPLETVRTRLKRGLAKLRQRLDTEFGDRSSWCLAMAPLAGVKLGGVVTAGSAVSAVGKVSGGILMASKVKVGLVAAVVVMSLGFGLVSILWVDGKKRAEKEASEPNPTVLASTKSEEVGQETGLVALDTQGSERTALASDFAYAEFYGRVVSKKEQAPISNAKIVFTLLPAEEKPCRKQAFSDKEGYFSVDLSYLKRNIPSGVDMEVSADGYKNIVTVFRLQPTMEQTNCGRLMLESDPEYVIRIVDDFGEPISGAGVTVLHSRIGSVLQNRRTDDKGQVLFSEHELRPGFRDEEKTALHIKATGMASHFYFNNTADIIAPEEIVLQRSGTYSGLVVEGESKEPVAGQLVAIKLGNAPYALNLAMRDFMKNLNVTTDSKGFFEMPKVTVSNGASLSVTASSEVYSGAASWHREFPSLIEVSRTSGSEVIDLACLVVGYETGLPLRHLKVLHCGREYVTDSAGAICVEVNTRSLFLQLEAPDQRLFYEGMLKKEVLEQEFCTTPFRKIIADKVNVFLQDEAGRPIRGAHAYEGNNHVCGGSTFMSRNVGADGILRLKLKLTSPPNTSTGLSITAPGFCETNIETGFLARWIEENEVVEYTEDLVIPIVLKRNTISQGIRVVDDLGEPVQGAGLYAVLNYGDEEKTARGTTDQEGNADISFPMFDDGTLMVYNRPDTAVSISYDDIASQKKVVLVCNEEDSWRYRIRGKVVDEDGKPLNFLNFDAWRVVGDEHHGLAARRLGDDGNFAFSSVGKGSFEVRIKAAWYKGIYYFEKKVSELMPGEDITITVDSIGGVRVRLGVRGESTNQNKNRRIAETWLEKEDGSNVEFDKLVLKGRIACLLGVDDGFYRAVIRTDDGKTHYSATLKVSSGKCEKDVVVEL